MDDSTVQSRGEAVSRSTSQIRRARPAQRRRAAAVSRGLGEAPGPSSARADLFRGPGSPAASAATRACSAARGRRGGARRRGERPRDGRGARSAGVGRRRRAERPHDAVPPPHSAPQSRARRDTPRPTTRLVTGGERYGVEEPRRDVDERDRPRPSGKNNFTTKCPFRSGKIRPRRAPRAPGERWRRLASAARWPAAGRDTA